MIILNYSESRLKYDLLFFGLISGENTCHVINLNKKA